MGEDPLSTLSMPSLEAPPPRIAVRILSPIDSRLAHGEGETESVSMLSLLLGPVAPPLNSICITIPGIPRCSAIKNLYIANGKEISLATLAKKLCFGTVSSFLWLELHFTLDKILLIGRAFTHQAC